MRNLSRFAWLMAIAFAAMPVYAQDDSSATPPQVDNGAAPAQDEGAPPPDDDGNGAADPGVSFQTFYDALGNQGTWIQSNDYGYVWQPTVSDPDWAPYTLGHWVYTSDGWTWVSDESFGWATYHYGRWVNLDGTGWCWVPGYTWAPAWVAWRYGNGYAGWAPLPPDSFVGVDYSDDTSSFQVGFHIGGDCDAFYGIGAGWYNFVPVTCLGYGNYHGYYRNRGDNYAIINHTTNVTNINVTRGGAAVAGAAPGARSFHRVTTGGPMLAEVNAASASPIQRVNLVRTGQPGGGGTVSGNSLSLFAPRVNSGGAAQPQRVSGTIGNAAINRGTDVMRPLAVNSQMGGAAATEAQVQQARIAANHAPASAKVMNDETMVRPILQAPLSSMHPVAREVSQQQTVTSPQSEFSNPQREPSTSVITPQQRVYPQTTSASPYYQPRPAATSPGTVPETHTYVRPSVAPGAPVVHQQESQPAPQSQGGSSGGGYPGNGGGGYPGGGNRGGASGGGGGNYHSGGNSQQNH
jgi:hypothetical protein